jgi:transcriptional regulator with XRE-family HTH domain
MSRPKRRTPSRETMGVLTTKLRETIRERGLTAYAVARDAGADARGVQRFLDGERGLTLDTADRIAAALGLRLVEAGSRRGKLTKPSAQVANPVRDDEVTDEA